jgi:hypothetical protein
MKRETITATVPPNEEAGTEEMTASITVDYAETVEEAVRLYGAEALLTNAFANWRITLQANIRNGLKGGEDQAAIQARLGSAKMGVPQRGIRNNPVQAYLARFQAATPEQQKAMLAELQARAAKE